MLTADDTPTIRNALHKRLDALPGARIDDIKFLRLKDHLHVTVLLSDGDAFNVQSEFDLPNNFEHAHLVNEIDEIAEQCKSARLQYWLAGRPVMLERRELPGTGLRGRWGMYG